MFLATLCIGIEALIGLAVATSAVNLSAPWEGPPTTEYRHAYSVARFTWGCLTLIGGALARVLVAEAVLTDKKDDVVVWATLVLSIVTYLLTLVMCARDTWWGRDQYVSFTCPVCDGKGCGVDSATCHRGMEYHHA